MAVIAFRSPSSRAAFHGADRSLVAKKLASVCKSDRQCIARHWGDERLVGLVAGHEVGTIDPVGWSCATTSAEK
jgi:D-arabinose 1-dehydrogenase-like Zn-dependent alcohol dehydrogenase